MRIDRAGAPFVTAALVPAVVLLALWRPWLAAPFAALSGMLAYFFRDPDRQAPADPTAVLSPADGRVLVAGPADRTAAPPGDWQQVSIFLSPLDVHVNRIPVSGRLVRVEYHRGQFLPAYRGEAGSRNERNELWIDHGGEMVVCRQITGVLVRRVVCRLAAGADVRAGDRFGIMKFGSRIDLFLPTRAVLRVRPGDRVRSGESMLAAL
ncbi:MAG: phosphatidylserine decarboxylase family protein [Planctomycetes bacterium]|nr:phosphatidylserine decarboxylase family protein [Planctomycetota bacterium]